MKSITAALATAALTLSTPVLANGWGVAQDTSSKFDGRTGVLTQLAGTAFTADDKTFPAFLNVSCNRKTTYVIVVPMRDAMPSAARMSFAYHRETPVRYKVEGGPAGQATWGASTDNHATGTQGGEAIAILKRLSAGDQDKPRRLFIEAKGMSGTGTFVFDIAGIKDAVAPIAKECGW